MKIRWPSLWFGPINLWTAPHQPALEDTMTAVEADAVQEQLCARIDELEREKEVLVAQLDQAESERDGLGRLVHDKAVMLQRAESRAIRQALGFEPDADDVSPNDLLMALVRIKAEWQADMLEELIRRSKIIGTDEAWTVDELEQEEANLRRRAKEAIDG